MIYFIGYCIIAFLLICVAVFMDGYTTAEYRDYDDPSILPVLIVMSVVWPISIPICIIIMIIVGFFSGLHQMAQTKAEQDRAARSTNSNRS